MQWRVGEAGCVTVTKEENLIMISSCKHPDQLVFPKGGIHEGEESSIAAQRETIEEAGVIGSIEGDLGTIKRCRWFVLRVDKFYDRWPEMHKRRRVLIPAGEAMERTDLRPKARLVLQAYLAFRASA